MEFFKKLFQFTSSNTMTEPKLTQKLLDRNEILFSPFSISNAMATLVIGSTNRDFGNFWELDQTNDVLMSDKFREGLERMHSVLNNDKTKLATLVLSTNAVNPAYISTIKSFAQHNQFDPNNPEQAANTVNKFVCELTRHMITKIIGPTDIAPTSTLILTNAFYFKDNWRKPFDLLLTKSEPFSSKSGESRQMDMMNGRFKDIDYYEDSTMQAIELEYEGKYRMGIILPRSFSTALHIPKFIKANVIVKLPKFTIEHKFSLNSILQTDPIWSKIFSPGSLEHISPGAYVSDFIHSAKIIVDETGTTAAAASSMGIRAMCYIPEKWVEFSANHSFIYYIKTGDTVLFAGILD